MKYLIGTENDGKETPVAEIQDPVGEVSRVPVAIQRANGLREVDAPGVQVRLHLPGQGSSSGEGKFWR